MNLRLFIFILSLAFGADSINAQLPTSVLESTSRQAVQIGADSRIGLAGERLDELTGLLVTALDGAPVNVIAKPVMAPPQPLRDWTDPTNEFDLSIPGDVAPSLVEVRTEGRLGVSNSRRLLLAKIPIDLPDGSNTTRDAAYAITSGHIVNDRTAALASKFYRVTLGPAQWLRCVAYCKQLDSLADLNIRLLDPSGRPLVSSRTIGAWPAEVEWKNERAESLDVFIEIHDLLKRGGDLFNYVLEARVEDALPAETPSALISEKVESPALHLDELLRPKADSSKLADFQSSTNQVIDASGQSQISIENFPALIAGTFSTPLRVDFRAEQGQAIAFDVASARLDQTTDPALALYKIAENEKGEITSSTLVGDRDDGPYVGTPAVRMRQIDPSWVWTASETAKYRLVVYDNQSGERSPESLRFYLSIQTPTPAFSLIAYRAFPTNDPAGSRPWGSNLVRLGTERIHATVVRRHGFAETIQLHVVGLPEGCRCEPVIVPASATEATLVVQAPESIVDATLPIQVVGTAQFSGQTLSVAATPYAIWAAPSPTYNVIQSRPTGALEVSLVSDDTAPLQIQLGETNVVEAKVGEKFTVPVNLTRSAGSAAECILRPQDLPAKVTVGEVKIPGDQSSGNAELTIAGDAPVGEHTLWMLAETKVKWRVNPQSLEREEAYLAKLQSALTAFDAGQTELAQGSSREQIESAIAATNAKIEQLKKATAEQELPLWLPTNTLRLKISQ